MRIIHIYGGSDDLIEIEGELPGCDEYDTCANNLPPQTFEILTKSSKGGRMKLHAIYDGCWSFALGMVEEDESRPDWPERRWFEGYSEHIELQVPDDTRIARLNRK